MPRPIVVFTIPWARGSVPRVCSTVMDRALLVRHLALSEEYIRLGSHRIQHQREIVAKLERRGGDAIQARRLLDNFEELQRMHIADRDRVRRELSAPTPEETMRERAQRYRAQAERCQNMADAS